MSLLQPVTIIRVSFKECRKYLEDLAVNIISSFFCHCEHSINWRDLRRGRLASVSVAIFPKM